MNIIKRITFLLVAVATLAGGVAFTATASRHADQEAAPIFVTEIPPGYRDWRLISVAREEGSLDDIRAILGNDVAIKAYREGKLPFPEGTIIARIAWSYDASDENNKVFGRILGRSVDRQSFVAGPPKNGIQFMVKDSKKYAATGGWGFAQFDDGKPAGEKVLNTCFACHAAIKERDLVFTRYALAEAGATVVVPARTQEKAQTAVAGIPQVEMEELELIAPLQSTHSPAGFWVPDGRWTFSSITQASWPRRFVAMRAATNPSSQLITWGTSNGLRHR